jgi:hypothetical protein
MNTLKEKESKCYTIKFKEVLKLKNHTQTGEIFQLKNNILGQDLNKKNKLLLNGILYNLLRVVKLMEYYKDQKSLHKRYTLQLLEKCT